MDGDVCNTNWIKFMYWNLLKMFVLKHKTYKYKMCLFKKKIEAEFIKVEQSVG